MTQLPWRTAVRIVWLEMGAFRARYQTGATLMLMTQEQALAESADRRVVLRDGLVVHS